MAHHKAKKELMSDKGMSKFERILNEKNKTPMIPGLQVQQETKLKGKYLDHALNDIHSKPRLGHSKKELGKFFVGIIILF
jgi:hypothetical protein